MAQTKLNTQNPESLHYRNGILSITILGGIKLTGLDRMRVTLKMEVNGTAKPPLRHNLDLYNDNQLEKLIRKACGKLEVGLTVIDASLSEVTELLEKYRLEKQNEEESSTIKVKQLTDKERKAATTFLEQPDLLKRTSELVQQSGIVGEEQNALLMYLIFTSRKREQPLHVVSLGASGMGKTHLQEKVGALIPEEDRIEITSLTENAFYYFGQQELKHKLILIEDLDGAESALYPIRELQSKKYISKTNAKKTRRAIPKPTI
ncbi:MAG: hypothetical protein JKY54_17825 [Flavobacteriales bacterium]|nr:hypothetical protein [Flavobacteriales bacterium]